MAAAKKETKLSIVIRAVDNATAKIKAINDRLDAATKPFRDIKKQLGDLREKSGLDDVIGGFQGVGSAIAGVLSKVALVGGALAAATAGVIHLIDGFAELGDKAEAIGVSVDFLAQMRYAAERSGAEVQQLDQGMKNFTKSLGMARAGTGSLVGFIGKVSPALLKQLKGAKSNEAAFELLAGAMAKLQDPAKRAALAQAAFGDASLAPLFAKGPAGLKELRDRYAELAGPQGEAAEAAGEFDAEMKDLKATTDGLKAALVTGLAPGLKVVVERLREWLVGHRGDIKEWAVALGKRIPSAVSSLVAFFRRAVDAIKPFVDNTTKLKVVGVALAAVIAGPLVSAITTLGVALLTTPLGWVVAGVAAITAAMGFLGKALRLVVPAIVAVGAAMMGIPGVSIIAGIAAAASLLIEYWEPIAGFFSTLWGGIVDTFKAAWGVIKGIVDAVINAVDKVISAAGRLGGVGAIRDILEVEQKKQQAAVPDVLSQIGPASTMTEARVKVDFANLPRGARVAADPQSTADVDLSVGYQMAGAL